MALASETVACTIISVLEAEVSQYWKNCFLLLFIAHLGMLRTFHNGFFLQSTGFFLQSTGFFLLSTGFFLQSTSKKLQATSKKLQALTVAQVRSRVFFNSGMRDRGTQATGTTRDEELTETKVIF